jgi:hypothetical protein
MKISNRRDAISIILGLLASGYISPAAVQGQPATPLPTSKVVFAGKWIGTLRIESQDSYRGNNAKGEHKVSSAEWIIEVSNDERTVTFRPASWHGPPGHAATVHNNEHTIRWTESVKASMSAPIAVYRSDGQKVGTGVGLRPDYDATWTMRATSGRTATLLCESNREDAYARITNTRITGTLTKK